MGIRRRPSLTKSGRSGSLNDGSRCQIKRKFLPVYSIFLFPIIAITFLAFLWVDPALAQENISPEVSEETLDQPMDLSSGKGSEDRLITLDFNNVDLVVFIRFISEIIGKNFLIDERVRGKVTIFSPAKIAVNKVYEVFLSVLELKGFAAVESENAIQILPLAEVPVEREVFVHFLQNADAEEITKLLTGIVAQPGGKKKATRGRKATPQRTAASISSDFEGPVQITPDKTINALVIRSTENDYEKLKKIIEQLDIKRQQVFVEAVIMEASQETLREFGTDLGALGGYSTPNRDVAIGGVINSIPSAVGDLAGFGSLVPNFNLGAINIGAVISALQDLSDVNILSTPQILTTHNQKARIVVGQNVPFPTGSSTTAGGGFQRNVTRQDVGVTLEITPRVMEQGKKVQLDIRQEISTVSETAESVLIELGPTTNKREAMTTVIVENHQTVVIGGLMRDDVTKIERKIPLLGDIPLLGWLFRFKSTRSVKTNLLIFLTPHILQDAEDLEAIRREKTAQMKDSMSNVSEDFKKRRNEYLDPINLPGSS